MYSDRLIKMTQAMIDLKSQMIDHGFAEDGPSCKGIDNYVQKYGLKKRK